MNDYTYTTTSVTTTGTSTVSTGLFLTIFLVFFVTLLVIFVISAIAGWKIFKKAGVEGWKALIPVYNQYLLLEIAGYNGFLVFLSFIPGGSLAVLILTGLGLAKNFGKSTAFAIVALMLFSPIGYLMLAFGNAKYLGGYFGGKSMKPITPASPKVSTESQSNSSETTPSDNTTPRV